MIDNLIKFIRRRDMFAPSETETTTPLNNDGFMFQQPAEYDTPMLDQYKQHLGTNPNRADYNPGKGYKILSGIASFFGNYDNPANAYSQTRGMLDEPYQRARADFRDKGSILGELADVEQKDIATKVTNRKVAYDQMLDWQKLLIDKGYKEAQIKDLNSQIQNRGLDIINDETTGNKVVVSKSDPNYRVDLGKFAESVSERRNNDFIDFTKQEGVKDKNTRAQINLRGGIDRGLTILRGQQDESLMDRGFLHRGELAKLTNNLETEQQQKLIPLRGANSVNTGLPPTQDNAAFEGAVRRVLAGNPQWRSFYDTETKQLTFDPTDGPLWYSASEDDKKEYENFLLAVDADLKTSGSTNTVGPNKTIPLNPPDTIIPPEVVNVLGSVGDGRHELTDGSVWIKQGGKITRGN